METTLFTGGSGLLGKAMQEVFDVTALFPTSSAFNVVEFNSMDEFLNKLEREEISVSTLVHMAALTSPPRVEENSMLALETNIIGTANVVKLCHNRGIRIVYISTDYVFSGENAPYSEDDPVCPVNKYAISKLGGECAVRLYDKHVIIRLSFGQNEFPYPAAYIDQWTSRLPVKEAVPKIIRIIKSDFLGTIHIGSKPHTVYDYAKSISPDKDIKEISIKDSKTKIPRDTSLNTTKFDTFIAGGW
jgi:dTDP-4-dehydrorhamnose reductase